MLVSILIPVYNEENTITQILEKVLSIKLPPRWSKQIIVVDDGSTDFTKNKLKKFSRKVLLITHSHNSGKGAAIRTALLHATGNVILIQDADLEYNPDDIKSLLQPFSNPEVKAVFGSRLKSIPLTISNLKSIPLPMHFLANKFLSLLTRILYGQLITDMETGYKAIDRKLIMSLRLSSSKFEIEPEITCKLLRRGVKIYEIPIKVKTRSYSQGKKITTRDGFVAIWALVKYRFL